MTLPVVLREWSGGARRRRISAAGPGARPHSNWYAEKYL